MQAIAMILGLKICFAPPDSITGFFSTSLIEDSFERRSSCIFVLSAPFSIAEAMFATRGVLKESWRAWGIHEPINPHCPTPPWHRDLHDDPQDPNAVTVRLECPLAQHLRDRTVVLPIIRACAGRWCPSTVGGRRHPTGVDVSPVR
jgi:hypothetical protein